MKSREEEIHQAALVGWFRMNYRDFKDLLFIIANGENVGPVRMNRLKKMGLSPGMPDLMLCVTTNLYPGMFIEMKSKSGRVRSSQKAIHEQLELQKYKIVVSHGWDTARLAIEEYLKGYNPEHK